MGPCLTRSIDPKHLCMHLWILWTLQSGCIGAEGQDCKHAGAAFVVLEEEARSAFAPASVKAAA